MTKFTNKQLLDQAREEVDFWRERDELIPSQQTAIRLRLAEIAMAALMTPKQEPVADVVAWSSPSEEWNCDIRWRRHDVKPGPLYTAPPAPVVPDGYALVPMKLTAENGAKGALLGEFSETKFINCPECFGDGDCETCDGSGRIEVKVPVTWTTIKGIWAKGVEHFAAAPQQEVK